MNIQSDDTPSTAPVAGMEDPEMWLSAATVALLLGVSERFVGRRIVPRLPERFIRRRWSGNIVFGPACWALLAEMRRLAADSGKAAELEVWLNQ